MAGTLVRDFIQVKVTKTAAFESADFDISGLTNSHWTLKCRITAMSAATGTPKCRFAFADSVDNFSAELPGPCLHIEGPVDSTNPITRSFQWNQFSALRFGTVSAELRFNLVEITATSTPTVTYEAWIEYGD